MTITDLSGRWEVCLDESKADALPSLLPLLYDLSYNKDTDRPNDDNSHKSLLLIE